MDEVFLSIGKRNPAQSKVDYDSRKLIKYFPDNMLTQVLSNSSCALDDYEKRLNFVVADYAKKHKIVDNLILKLPKVAIQDSLEDSYKSIILESMMKEW